MRFFHKKNIIFLSDKRKITNFADENKFPNRNYMINRELIRIKVVQLTYAYYQNGSNNIELAEKELFFSLSKAYDLYNQLLTLIVAVTAEERRRLDIVGQRAAREGREEPNQKFVLNRFALQLQDNEQLLDFISQKGNGWTEQQDFVEKLTTLIENSQTYQEYMLSEEDSYAADRELWRKIYRTMIEGNEDLDQLLEEQSLYWNDDKAIVDTFVLKTIKRFEEKNGTRQELLAEYNSNEEKEYARRLFRAAILNADEYQRYMSNASHNWDISRLAFMDMIIMQIAIAEMMTFPSIPIHVTINEYVELSKYYSTPRSFGYINGMLDAIAGQLTGSGKLLKPFKENKQ